MPAAWEPLARAPHTSHLAEGPLTFNRRRLQPLADSLHTAVGVVNPGDRLGTPQLHEIPELHHGAAKVPLMVAFSNRVPGVVVSHVVRHLVKDRATKVCFRGELGVAPQMSPSLGVGWVQRYL